MNTRDYATKLERKLIDEFKKNFYEKLGYEPIVMTVSKLKTTDDNYISLMSLEELKEVFDPFLPTINGKIMQLETNERWREIVELRAIYCHLAVNMNYTLQKTGRSIGNRDHTTVRNSLMNFRNWMETNEPFREKYRMILNHITSNQNMKNNESQALEHLDQMECES